MSESSTVLDPEFWEECDNPKYPYLVMKDFEYSDGKRSVHIAEGSVRNFEQACFLEESRLAFIAKTERDKAARIAARNL